MKHRGTTDRKNTLPAEMSGVLKRRAKVMLVSSPSEKSCNEPNYTDKTMKGQQLQGYSLSGYMDCLLETVWATVWVVGKLSSSLKVSATRDIGQMV